jgi:hypothetical protein
MNQHSGDRLASLPRLRSRRLRDVEGASAVWCFDPSRGPCGSTAAAIGSNSSMSACYHNTADLHITRIAWAAS